MNNIDRLEMLKNNGLTNRGLDRSIIDKDDSKVQNIKHAYVLFYEDRYGDYDHFGKRAYLSESEAHKELVADGYERDDYGHIVYYWSDGRPMVTLVKLELNTKGEDTHE